MERIKFNGIDIFVEEAENFIQINDIQGDDLLRIWEPLTTQYPGFEVTLCFRDMTVPTAALDSIGAVVLEDCISMKVTPPEFKPHPSHEIELLEMADFDEFAALHDKLNPDTSDMYWTSRRMRDKWDIWRVLVLKIDGKITGYSMIMVSQNGGTQGEIFCVEADTVDHRKALVSATVDCAFNVGNKLVLNMVDRDNTRDYDVSLAVGFRETGFYVGYIHYPQKEILTDMPSE